jgi:hypothetical protein
MGYDERSNKRYYEDTDSYFVLQPWSTHPTSKIDGNAGIMRVSEEFLGSFGARRRNRHNAP